MCEQRLSIRSKTCMHLKNSSSFYFSTIRYRFPTLTEPQPSSELKRLQLCSKTHLTMSELILSFFVGMCLLSSSSSCMEWNLPELLNCVSLSTTSFFWKIVWGVFWSVLYLFPYILDAGFSNNGFWLSSKQTYCFSYVFQPPLVASSDEKTLWLQPKTSYFVFK